MTRAQWNALVRASVLLPQDGARKVGRYVALDVVLKVTKKPKAKR